MSTEEKLGQMRRRFGESAAEAAYEAARARAAAEFDAKLAMVPTGSPIERLLVAQMLLDGWCIHRRSHVAVSPAMTLAPAVLVVIPQYPLTVRGRGYRLDFVFTTVGGVDGNRERPLAVELDGHDFHERTKEQASSDRARDRALLALGTTTIRFTGSDVYRDPKAVLDECIATTWRLAKARK